MLCLPEISFSVFLMTDVLLHPREQPVWNTAREIVMLRCDNRHFA